MLYKLFYLNALAKNLLFHRSGFIVPFAQSIHPPICSFLKTLNSRLWGPLQRFMFVSLATKSTFALSQALVGEAAMKKKTWSSKPIYSPIRKNVLNI